MTRRCAWNAKHEIPAGARKDSKFCSTACRQASWRFAVTACGLAPGERAMRFSYMDPPYPGKAHLYPEGREVDHAALVARAVLEYPDGWALSTSAGALQHVLGLCPGDVRVCAWIRMGRHVKSARAINCWEPLIVWRGRPLAVDVAQVLDDVLETSDVSPGSGSTRCSVRPPDVLVARGRFRGFPGALVGMKPPAFSEWMFRQLGARPGDTLHDAFPGSGAVGLAWHRFVATEDTSPVDRGTDHPSPRGMDDGSADESLRPGGRIDFSDPVALSAGAGETRGAA